MWRDLSRAIGVSDFDQSVTPGECTIRFVGHQYHLSTPRSPSAKGDSHGFHFVRR
jgi:hypothetical protein